MIRPTCRRALVPIALTCVIAGCGSGFPPPELPPFSPIPEPDPSSVEAVLFLVGDAGQAETGRSPLLANLRGEVERWSKALGRDSAVAVAFLGDNVYPRGLRDRSDRHFPADSTRLWSQIDVVSGPAARAHATAGWFLPGNHDWGGMVGRKGIARLRNQAEALERARGGGEARVAMLPEAGRPGPAIRDVGTGYRIVILDTDWFLRPRDETESTAFFDELQRILESAGDREIIVLAHHPWETSGPHGVTEGGRALGYYWLLEKSGTLVQDLDSPVYSDFIGQFRERVAAADRRPLLFAGGHDHSLQVFRGDGPTDPEHVLVSGAGSKLTRVSAADGLRFAASRPGYMTLVFRTSGELDLYVTAGDPELQPCRGDDTARATCLRRGIAAFETVYSAVLRPGQVP